MASIGNWPTDLIPYRWEFYLKPNSQNFMSPVTRSRQATEGQGQQWQALGQWRMEIASADGRRRAQKMKAWLDKMRGTVNTVNLPDFADKGRALGPLIDLSSLGVTTFTDGSGFTDGGSPETITYFSGGTAGITVYGNWSVGAEQVLATGLPQGTTGLYAGDNVQLGSFLYRLQEDLVGNGLNRGYMHLNRPLVEAVSHGTALITEWARTPMRLVDDDQSRASVDALRPVWEFSAAFEESLFFLNEFATSEEGALTDSPDGTVGTSVVIDGELWTLG